jgi:hypothetical protein
MTNRIQSPRMLSLGGLLFTAVFATASYPNCAFAQSRVTGYQTVGRDMALHSWVVLHSQYSYEYYLISKVALYS